MLKNKKIIILLVVFILGAALFTGCGTDVEDETGTGEPSKPVDNNEGSGDVSNQPEEGINPDPSGTQPQTNAAGILKAADAESVTISDEEGGELVLTVTSDTKIQIGDADSAPADLAGKIGSEVSAEYDEETKTATVVNIKE